MMIRAKDKMEPMKRQKEKGEREVMGRGLVRGRTCYHF